MISSLNIARIAKVVALLGFLLPWVLVSCSGQPVGRLSGIDLATGGGMAQQHADPNLWVIVALAATISGIVVSFIFRGRAAAAGLGGLALVALAASGIGVGSAGAAAPAGALRAPGAASPAADAGSGAEVNLQYGYFITVAGLLVAVGACGATLAGRGRADSS
jgi:hypothetical protein